MICPETVTSRNGWDFGCGIQRGARPNLWREIREGFLEDRLPELSPDMLIEHLLCALVWISVREMDF